jgi:hypothetical protein
MHTFYAHNYGLLMSFVALASYQTRFIEKWGDNGEPGKKEIKHLLHQIKDGVSELPFNPIILDQTNRVLDSIDTSNPADVSIRLEDLMLNISSDMRSSIFLMLPSDVRSLYEQAEPHYGREVEVGFPSLLYDIDEAGKCLALERSTAATFHSIRCLEAGFTAIWRYLGVPDPITGYERNWSNRVNRVAEKIEEKWPKKSGRMSDEAKFFDKIIGTFHGMQNPYRNNTMHFDEKYTVEEAEEIFLLVKGIMKRVASRMDENGQPLA